MRLSLQQKIYTFTFISCFLFVVLVLSTLWSAQVVETAMKREEYANKIEGHTHILKQFIISENIYAINYNTEHWFALDQKFKKLLKLAPALTPQQQTIQNSIESQNKNVLRLFNAINKNKLKNADEIIKKHLKIRLITQLEAILSDSTQLSTIVKKDIKNVIKHQVIFIVSILALSLCVLIIGAFSLIKVFRASLNEVKEAFEKNHSGRFQKIHLSTRSEEFESIAIAFNAMNKKLSETTISLESMRKIVAEKTYVLEQLSKTDSLTNIANRRALFERGSAEFSRVQRNQSLLSVILLDCDLFKNINDQYGHLFGDEVLKRICKVCSDEIRKIDFFARYGGEEFIILLPDSELSGAIETAKRIQRSLANNCLAFEGNDVHVTVSIGISMANAEHKSFEALLNSADTAMYEAKKNGRDRIEVFEGSISP